MHARGMYVCVGQMHHLCVITYDVYTASHFADPKDASFSSAFVVIEIFF